MGLGFGIFLLHFWPGAGALSLDPDLSPPRGMEFQPWSPPPPAELLEVPRLGDVLLETHCFR